VLKSQIDRFEAWYERESRTTNYDLFMRLPALLYFGFSIMAQGGQWLDAALAGPNLAEPTSLATFAARSAYLVVIVLFAGLTLLRRKAVSRSSGLMPRLVAFAAVGILFAFPFIERSEPVLGFEIASAVLGTVSCLFTSYVVLWLGRSFSTMPEARRLVTGGPYRLSRHPLYLAEEIAMVGLVLQYRSLAGLALLSVQISLQIARTFYEERVLGEAFPEYEAYRATTPRLIPGVI
jgi:protein-S-isoprenylcysteine O-methyltransferase Ste14